MDYLEQYKNPAMMTDQSGQQMAKRPNQGGQGGQNGSNNKDNSEDDKFKNALSDAIVTTKPNVKWTDIAG